MRIDEFRDKIDKLGQKYDKNLTVSKYEVFDEDLYITVYIDYYISSYTIAIIVLKERYTFNTNEEGFGKLPEELQEELFDILVEFARTPVGEREEEKKYQYKLKEKHWWIADKVCEEKTYLNFRTIRDTFIDISLDNKEETEHYKTKFTDEEIEEVAEKYDIDLNVFDKIEVLDDYS